MPELILVDVPEGSTIGLWNGAEGVAGRGFGGFHSIPKDEVVLLRVSAIEAILVHMDTERVVLAWRPGSRRWERVASKDDDAVLRLTDSLLTSESLWTVTPSDVDKLRLRFNELLTAEICTFCAMPLVAFRDHLSIWMKDTDDDDDTHDIFLAQLELAFALFVSIGLVEGFDVWRGMLRLCSAVPQLPRAYINVLSLQLERVPSEMVEESASFQRDLVEVMVRIVSNNNENEESCRRLASSAIKVLSVGDSGEIREKLEQALQGDESSELLTFVQASGASSSVQYQPESRHSFPRATRMDWML